MKKVVSKMLHFLPDKLYLQIIFKKRVGHFINFRNPKTFNEKLQFLKLNDRKSIYTQMADKLSAKLIVSECLGEEYVVPTYGVWFSFDEIDFNSLPDQFVLKCNHDSGGVVICRNKQNFDYNSAKEKLEKHLKNNAYWYGREWPYKNIKPCIFAEKFIKQSMDNGEKCDNLIVYKCFVFNGKVKIIQVIQDDKTENETIDYYDEGWNLLNLRQNFPNSTVHLAAPQKLSEMIFCAEYLAKECCFLRVDFYETDRKLLFSEFTFYSDNGMAKFEPNEWDAILGKYLRIE